MTKIEEGRGGPIESPPSPSRLRVTSFSSRLLRLKRILARRTPMRRLNLTVLRTKEEEMKGSGSVVLGNIGFLKNYSTEQKWTTACSTPLSSDCDKCITHGRCYLLLSENL